MRWTQRLYKALFLMGVLVAPLAIGQNHFADLGPLEYGKAHSATALCPPDLHFKCPEQTSTPTPLSPSLIHPVAFRVQSFGDTQLTIFLKATSGEDSPFLKVEGPLEKSGDSIAIGTGPVHAQSPKKPGSARLDIALKLPGVYRVLATTQPVAEGEPANADTSLEITATCSKNCTRSTVGARQFLKQYYKPLIEESSLEPYLRERIERASFPGMQDGNGQEFDLITKQLHAFLRDETDRFPVLPPLPELNYLRPLVGGLESRLGNPNLEASRPKPKLSGSVQEILSTATPARAYPEPLYKHLPNITYGHFPLETLSPVQVAHSHALAQMLTFLADGRNQLHFKTDREKRTLHSPWDLFDLLISTGHTIEVANERTYANFISLNDKLTSIQWPVWLDSGVSLSNGENLIAPVGHSQHTWYIRGPLVDARVAFFLGISGVGFWPQIDERPAWTGHRVAYSASSATQKSFILETVKAATSYYKRIRAEVLTVAQNKPADGYGYLGLCNDSNAAIELKTHKTISAYPIARAKELDRLAPQLNDGLDEVLRKLPKDADADLDNRGYRQDVLQRLWAMSAHLISSPHIPDNALAKQLRLLKQDLIKSGELSQDP